MRFLQKEWKEQIVIVKRNHQSAASGTEKFPAATAAWICSSEKPISLRMRNNSPKVCGKKKIHSQQKLKKRRKMASIKKRTTKQINQVVSSDTALIWLTFKTESRISSKYQRPRSIWATSQQTINLSKYHTLDDQPDENHVMRPWCR